MTMHNHVLVRASYPGDCPGCDVVWDAIRIPEIDQLLAFDVELQVARSLQCDYGDREMHHHLSALMQKGQRLKWQLEA
ncbi:hypothetical protein SEA_BIG4_266 [Microbacterium phage Big4]|nr:hypothetical protein SEA_BIG4_266 [Microbacterium phage Big4]